MSKGQTEHLKGYAHVCVHSFCHLPTQATPEELTTKQILYSPNHAILKAWKSKLWLAGFEQADKVPLATFCSQQLKQLRKQRMRTGTHHSSHDATCAA